MKYYWEYQEGSRGAHRDECPYSAHIDIGRFCAWMGGFNDYSEQDRTVRRRQYRMDRGIIRRLPTQWRDPHV